ncbi:MAG: hypothetical protein IJC43_06405 [Clostridia bacterium]|nr:hypothetical protein [Clostridia bacterium]
MLDSLAAAIKNNEVSYKYHNLRARVIALWDLCGGEVDCRVFYLCLSTLAILAKDYEYALEPLVRCRKYRLAASVATMGGLTESARVFSLCALLSGESGEIDQYISEICVARHDAQVLEHLLDDRRGDSEALERIASCAYYLFTASGGKLRRDITPYDSAYDAAAELLASIPPQWRCRESAVDRFAEFESYSFPDQPAAPAEEKEEEELLTGVITRFEKEPKWGFLSKTHYFYITQVRDDTERGILLRKLLELGLWDQLEVSFKLGESVTQVGNSAATSLELTEKGAAEALARIESARPYGARQEGFVEVYFPYYRNGRIQTPENKYNFKLSAVTDPWLRAYYANTFSPKEQDVTFDAAGRNAFNVCWKEPDEAIRASVESYVSEAEKEAFARFLEGLNAPGDKVKLPEEDPFASFRYTDLPAWRPKGKNVRQGALAWGGKTCIREAEPEKPAEPEATRAASARPVAEKPSRPASDSRAVADQARRARLSGQLEQAAHLFETALQQRGDFDERVLGDYITVLQQVGRIDDALEVLRQYEKQLSDVKLLNLRIGLYDKKKDYKALCPLYESAFQSATTVSTKSHNLIRLIDAYSKLGEYENALATCQRWETFYNQNRFSTDAEKLHRVSASISRHKAYCYYFLGRVEEAREIATSLVRLNPADAIANSILDGTLGNDRAAGAQDAAEILTLPGADELTDISPDDEFSEEEDEGTEESRSRLSRFVRAMIAQADLTANLKSSGYRDGRYVGSTEDGLKDAKQLADRRRISARARSDSLFAACKLIEQLEQNDENHRNLRNLGIHKVRYAGRGMAAWGDVMVAQARQMDTARMAYLYALRVLTPLRRGPEQSWVDSYNRYIKSFFLAQSGSNSLEEYITAQTNRSDRDGANTDVLADGRIPDVLLPEFTVGMLLLTDALGTQKNRQVTFLEELYSRNPELRRSVCRQLKDYVETGFVAAIGKGEFVSMMQEAAEKLKARAVSLSALLTDIASTLMKERIPTGLLAQLQDTRWSSFLTATDRSRLSRISYIVRRSQEYYDSGDFESRADCLRAVMLEVNELLQQIRKEPTDVSYDIFLPALDQMSLKLTDKQAELYQTLLPRLSLEETIPPFRTPDGQVQIQLTVKNGQNYQTADSFTITAVSGPEVLRCDLPAPLQSLRGGEEAEVGLRVTVDGAAEQSGSFSATISCAYKCSDWQQTSITRSMEQTFTFVIRSEDFKALSNPFAAYEENVMADETMFLGRSTQIEQIAEMLRTPAGGPNYGRAIAVYGQTRTGKTSLLYHLTNRLRDRYGDQILIWDIGNLGELGLEDGESFMANFVYALLDTGLEAIRKDKPLAARLAQEGLTSPLDEISERPSFAVTLFNAYMRRLNEILRGEGKLIVLMADEFTYLHGYIKSGRIPNEFMRFWKALLQNNCIFAIIAAQDNMPDFMREYPNEFACMELLRLNYLAEPDAKKLIRTPLEAANNRPHLFRDDGCVDEIYKLTAGSPYLTIILCSKLVSYLNEKGAYMVTRGIVDDFLRTRVLGPSSFLLEKHFEPQVDERGKPELHEINRGLLLSVARLSQTGGYARLQDIVSGSALSAERIEGYLARLVDRSVLVKEGRDGYRIQVKLLEKWLIDTMGV